MELLKRIAARCPESWQIELKRMYFRRQVRRNSFATDEPEYALLPKLLSPGDWVVDVGANVGHYTKRFSDLVSAEGRVIAFEPVPSTFSLLAANTQLFKHPNVTLINAALSESANVFGMDLPKFDCGLKNYYQAHLSASATARLQVLTLSLDSLRIQNRIALIKIDSEGHEKFVLSGMRELIVRDHPVLVIETGSEDIIGYLSSVGYDSQRLPGSPNMLFTPIHKLL